MVSLRPYRSPIIPTKKTLRQYPTKLTDNNASTQNGDRLNLLCNSGKLGMKRSNSIPTNTSIIITDINIKILLKYNPFIMSITGAALPIDGGWTAQ